MKNPNKQDHTFNVITIGESAVGKTCIISSFVDKKIPKCNLSTIGVEFTNKRVEIDNMTIKLKICDTAGQERFRNLTIQYYREAKGILLVYDILNINSFENLDYWMQQIKSNTLPEEISIVILGNKVDQENDRKVTYDQGKETATKYNVQFFETSAYENININEAFEALIRNMVEKKKQNNKNHQTDENQNQSIKNIDNKNKHEQKKKCC